MKFYADFDLHDWGLGPVFIFYRGYFSFELYLGPLTVSLVIQYGF